MTDRTPMEITDELRTISRYAAPAVSSVVDDAVDLIDDLQRTITSMETTVRVAEQLRPLWAQGYTSDSIAAQASSSALTELWEFLGVDNQTAACEKMRELKEKGLI